MLDLALNLLPDKYIQLSSGVILDYPAGYLHPLPDTNTRLIAISESDLAIILAMLSETQADYVPISITAVSGRSTPLTAYPRPFGRDVNNGEIVGVFGRPATVRYIGDVSEYDASPLANDIARALLRERLAIIRERLMVDLTAYMTRIAEAIEGIEEELGDATDAMERIAVAVESQTTSEGLDDIASAVGALAPLVALI